MTLVKSLKALAIAIVAFAFVGCVATVLQDPTGTYEVEWSSDITSFWGYVDSPEEAGVVLLEEAYTPAVFPGDLADGNLTVDFFPLDSNADLRGFDSAFAPLGTVVISGNANFVDGTIEIPVTRDTSFDFEAATPFSIVNDEILFDDLNCLFQEVEDFDFDWGSTDWDFNATVQRQYVWTDLEPGDVDYIDGLLGCEEDLFDIYPGVIADLDGLDGTPNEVNEIFFFADLAGLVPNEIDFEFTSYVGYAQDFFAYRVGLADGNEGTHRFSSSLSRTENRMAAIKAAFERLGTEAFDGRGISFRPRTPLTADIELDNIRTTGGVRIRPHVEEAQSVLSRHLVGRAERLNELRAQARAAGR
jgi:hypothetical protein